MSASAGIVRELSTWLEQLSLEPLPLTSSAAALEVDIHCSSWLERRLLLQRCTDDDWWDTPGEL